MSWLGLNVPSLDWYDVGLGGGKGCTRAAQYLFQFIPKAHTRERPKTQTLWVYYRQQPSPESPEDVSNWRWIRLDQLPSIRSFRRGDCLRQIAFQHQISVNSVEAVKQYCLLGRGLAILAKEQAEDLIQSGTLVHVLPDWNVDAIPMVALWPENVSPNSNVKKLLNALIDGPNA